MTLITGFTCPPTIYFKFITKCDKCYYKVRQLFLLQSAMVCYYKVRQLFYYKVRQVLQSVTILLQSATGITKCDDYYKVRQYIRQGGKNVRSSPRQCIPATKPAYLQKVDSKGDKPCDFFRCPLRAN